MRIISELTQTVRHYKLAVGERTYYYKEHLDDRGKVIEDELSDEDSHVYDNPALLEHIREFIDKHYNN